MSNNSNETIEGILNVGPVMPVIVIDDVKNALPLADGIAHGERKLQRLLLLLLLESLALLGEVDPLELLQGGRVLELEVEHVALVVRVDDFQ